MKPPQTKFRRLARPKKPERFQHEAHHDQTKKVIKGAGTPFEPQHHERYETQPQYVNQKQILIAIEHIHHHLPQNNQETY